MSYLKKHGLFVGFLVVCLIITGCGSGGENPQVLLAQASNHAKCVKIGYTEEDIAESRHIYRQLMITGSSEEQVLQFARPAACGTIGVGEPTHEESEAVTQDCVDCVDWLVNSAAKDYAASDH